MHQFRVQILDALGQVFFGVDIDFFANGAHLGGVKESDGKATIRYPASLGPVEVLVQAEGHQEVARIDSGQSSHTFSLPMFHQKTMEGKREARCADGTSGQPCVDCPVGNSTVRICA